MTLTATQPKERLTQIIKRAEELYEDLELNTVKEWKSKDKTRKAIGFLPIYVPREVIHACGALPVGILGGADRLEIVRGDSYFQSYICHLPRSVVELAVSGRLDSMDGFLFPSICDVVRNLSGMFQLFFKDKYIHYVDLPQNFTEGMGDVFYKEELQNIARGISKLTGVELSDERLSESISLYNKNRHALQELWETRRDRPWEVPTTEYYLLLRAAYLLPVEEHTQMVKEYLDLVGKAERRELDNIRVLVQGAFCEQPPLALLRTLERAGCYVVDDDFVLGARYIPEQLDETMNPIDAVVDGFVKKSLPAAFKFDACHTKSEDFVGRVKAVRADGVVLMAPSFCDPALLDQPMLQKALDDADIPYTSFKYSEDTGQFQVIREQAGTFADAIKLWGTS